MCQDIPTRAHLLWRLLKWVLLGGFIRITEAAELAQPFPEWLGAKGILFEVFSVVNRALPTKRVALPLLSHLYWFSRPHRLPLLAASRVRPLSGEPLELLELTVPHSFDRIQIIGIVDLKPH